MTSVCRSSPRLLVAAAASLALLGPACSGKPPAEETKRITALEAQVKTANETSQALAQRVARLEAANAPAAAELVAAKASVDELEGSIAGVQNEVKAAQNQSAAASRRSAEVDAKLGSLGGKVDEVDRAVKALKDKLDTYIRAHP